LKIYWTMNSVPELQGLDKAEKRRVFKEMQKHGRKKMGVMPWVWFGLTALVAAVVAVLLGLSGALGGGLIGGVIGFSAAAFLQTPAIEHGRVWYREQQDQSEA